ncbi:MAG: hypothetical protein ACRD4O_00405, partial [Bryobacteraceae bacterium]
MISNFLRRRSNRFYPGCILFGLALGVVWAFQASGDKVVYCNAPAQITDPVMITNVTVEGESVDCGLFVKPPAVVQSLTPFPAGSDWLQTMTISMINRTNKIIVFGQITLVFLDTGDCRAIPC